MSTEQNRQSRFVLWLFLAVALVFAINLSRGIISLLKARTRIESAHEQVVKLEAEKKELETQLKYQMSEGYTEKEIRDTLNMAKPDETVVILPQDVLNQESNLGKPLEPQPDKYQTVQPTWKKWLIVFGF